MTSHRSLSEDLSLGGDCTGPPVAREGRGTGPAHAVEAGVSVLGQRFLKKWWDFIMFSFPAG